MKHWNTYNVSWWTLKKREKKKRMKIRNKMQIEHLIPKTRNYDEKYECTENTGVRFRRFISSSSGRPLQDLETGLLYTLDSFQVSLTRADLDRPDLGLLLPAITLC